MDVKAVFNPKKTENNIETVRQVYEKAYNFERKNDMQKIQLKCWLYHSESRHKNGNAPFFFNDFIHILRLQNYLEYIDFGFIDCEDIGGKQRAKEVVRHYYGV